jgi:glycosyltransferase involved in cell wall biosynthesis
MQDHTRDLARGLALAGHEVEVITSRHPEGQSEECKDSVRYRFVNAPRHQNDPVWLRESYAEFIRLHREWPFDVVHSEASSGLEYVRRGVNRRLPVVVMFHGSFLGLAKAKLRSGVHARRTLSLLREIRAVQWLATHEHLPYGNWYRFRACEAIVASRQQLKDTCRSHLLKPARVHVVPNGIDTDLFRPRPPSEVRAELGLPEGPLFVCVGRLSRDKGYQHAVRALALLDGKTSNARLVIVGDGEERPRLEQLAQDLNLDGRVTFAGSQPPELVPLYLAAADAFLFPTERDEAAPLVLPQAMASALPVVASRIGGITEVLGDSRRYGILIRPGDTEALADAMRELLREDVFRRQLGEAARERVLAEYTLERMVERTLDVYRIAIARLGPRS